MNTWDCLAPLLCTRTGWNNFDRWVMFRGASRLNRPVSHRQRRPELPPCGRTPPPQPVNLQFTVASDRPALKHFILWLSAKWKLSPDCTHGRADYFPARKRAVFTRRPYLLRKWLTGEFCHIILTAATLPLPPQCCWMKARTLWHHGRVDFCLSKPAALNWWPTFFRLITQSRLKFIPQKIKTAAHLLLCLVNKL